MHPGYEFIEIVLKVLPRHRKNPCRQKQQGHALGQLADGNKIQHRRAIFCRNSFGVRVHQRILDSKNAKSSEIFNRSCFIVSRSRSVTVSLSSSPFSPSVSKSIVTPKGVPISSWRRYRRPIAPASSS